MPGVSGGDSSEAGPTEHPGRGYGVGFWTTLCPWVWVVVSFHRRFSLHLFLPGALNSHGVFISLPM